MCERATRKQKGSMPVMELMKVKGPTEVNFKHGGSQNIFHLLFVNLSLLSHFQNYGATVECSTLDFSRSS